jgi:hypothetical protein
MVGVSPLRFHRRFSPAGNSVGYPPIEDEAKGRPQSLVRTLRAADRIQMAANANCAQGRASSTRLKGVAVERRTRENPPVNITSRSLVSPA